MHDLRIDKILTSHMYTSIKKSIHFTFAYSLIHFSQLCVSMCVVCCLNVNGTNMCECNTCRSN